MDYNGNTYFDSRLNSDINACAPISTDSNLRHGWATFETVICVFLFAWIVLFTTQIVMMSIGKQGARKGAILAAQGEAAGDSEGEEMATTIHKLTQINIEERRLTDFGDIGGLISLISAILGCDVIDAEGVKRVKLFPPVSTAVEQSEIIYREHCVLPQTKINTVDAIEDLLPI